MVCQWFSGAVVMSRLLSRGQRAGEQRPDLRPARQRRAGRVVDEVVDPRPAQDGCGPQPAVHIGPQAGGDLPGVRHLVLPPCHPGSKLASSKTSYLNQIRQECQLDSRAISGGVLWQTGVAKAAKEGPACHQGPGAARNAACPSAGTSTSSWLTSCGRASCPASTSRETGCPPPWT